MPHRRRVKRGHDSGASCSPSQRGGRRRCPRLRPSSRATPACKSGPRTSVGRETAPRSSADSLGRKRSSGRPGRISLGRAGCTGPSTAPQVAGATGADWLNNGIPNDASGTFRPSDKRPRLPASLWRIHPALAHRAGQDAHARRHALPPGRHHLLGVVKKTTAGHRCGGSDTAGPAPAPRASRNPRSARTPAKDAHLATCRYEAQCESRPALVFARAQELCGFRDCLGQSRHRRVFGDGEAAPLVM